MSDMAILPKWSLLLVHLGPLMTLGELSAEWLGQLPGEKAPLLLSVWEMPQLNGRSMPSRAVLWCLG